MSSWSRAGVMLCTGDNTAGGGPVKPARTLCSDGNLFDPDNPRLVTRGLPLPSKSGVFQATNVKRAISLFRDDGYVGLKHIVKAPRGRQYFSLFLGSGISTSGRRTSSVFGVIL